MSGGGGKGGGDAVVGHKYFLGVHLQLHHGVADVIRQLYVGERVAWEGNALASDYQPKIDFGDFLQMSDSLISTRRLSTVDPSLLTAAIRYRVQNSSYGVSMGGVQGATKYSLGAQYSGQTYTWKSAAAVAKLIDTSVVGQVTMWMVAVVGTTTNGIQVRLTDSDSGILCKVLQAKSTPASNLNFNFNTGGTVETFSGSAKTTPISYSPFIFTGVTDDVGIGLSTLSYPASAQYKVDKKNLFGGEKREGGVAGIMDFLFGINNQTRNEYLAKFQGDNCPAYRKFTSIVFRKFYWSAMNPYFKSIWVRSTRMSRWVRGTPWYPSALAVRSLGDTGDALDMNPAHIIYESLTDYEWGMGYNYSDIDDVSFTEAANTLLNEGFGLSLLWSTQSSIESFIQTVLDHIGGMLQMNTSTGKFTLKLIRTDYDINQLTNLNVSNIVEFKSFQRAGYGDIANEVVVKYRDREESEKTVAVQDLASVQATGSVVSTTKEYDGIKTAALAYKVAVRDLTLLSSPLAKLEVTTNRVLWDKSIGDVVTLTWPDLGITLVPFRIISINRGSLSNGRIEVQLVEDVFGLPQGTYESLPTGEWVDESLQLLPPEHSRLVEAPYWSVFINNSRANMNFMEPEYGFGVYLAHRNEFTAPLGMRLYASPTSNGKYKEVAFGQFCPTGTILAAVGHIETTFYLDDYHDLDRVITDEDNGFAWIDNEIVAIESIDPLSGEVVVRRGCLDTVPATHAYGARVYFETGSSPADPTERVSGETTYYKSATVSGNKELSLDIASEFSMNFQNRPSRPYPPAQFRINTLYYPLVVNATSLVINWVHRNRLSQTVRLIDYSEGSITPESGTAYNVRVYNDATNALVGSSLNNPGTQATFILASGTYRVRVELESVVAGVTSLYRHSYAFVYNQQ